MAQHSFERTFLFRPGGLVPGAAMVLAATIGARASVPVPQAAKNKPAPAVMTKSVGDLTAEEEEEFSRLSEETIERVCIACHPFENITKTRRTVREWNDMVQTMAMRGAPGSENDLAAIKKYLTRYYGIVRVNTATPQELTSVLGLSAKDAAAVVEYRTAHGR